MSTLASMCALIALSFLGVVNSQESLHNITIDDSDPAITYLPVGSWLVSQEYENYTYGRGYHWTSYVGANAIFVFTGMYFNAATFEWYDIMKLGI